MPSPGEFESLPLPALRAYRQMLVDEESRVSYWRRILQARLDVLRAEEAGDGQASGAAAPERSAAEGSAANRRRLEAVLAHARVASRRAALIGVLPATVVPPLPQLEALWDVPLEGQQATPPSQDTSASKAVLIRLADAEQALSAYRGVLHVRLDQATVELVRRYAEDPRRCLGALPIAPYAGP